MSFDIGDAAALLGRTELRTADVHPEPAQLLKATLDRDMRDLEPGAALPLLWHWLYFPPLISQSRLGDDGHTRDSSLLPVVPFLPRRMWAGSRLRSDAPLRIGDRLTRRSEVIGFVHRCQRPLFDTPRLASHAHAVKAMRPQRLRLSSLAPS